MGTARGLYASVEQSANDGEGDGVLRVVQHVWVAPGCGENRCGISAKVPQKPRDTDERPGAHGTVSYRYNLCGSIFGKWHMVHEALPTASLDPRGRRRVAAERHGIVRAYGSNVNRRFQSCFMLITIQPFALASSQSVSIDGADFGVRQLLRRAVGVSAIALSMRLMSISEISIRSPTRVAVGDRIEEVQLQCPRAIDGVTFPYRMPS